MGCQLRASCGLELNLTKSSFYVLEICRPYTKVTEENFEFDHPDGQPTYQFGIDSGAVKLGCFEPPR